MPNIRMIIEYDGSCFHGWQVQPELKTVQGELHRVIETVLREKIHCVHVSGRTDAGVHARAQVVNIKTSETPDLYLLRHSINALLRGEVGVLSVEIAPDDFHSRHCSVAKEYQYEILNRPAPAVLEKGRIWHVPAELDFLQMQKAAKVLIGRHDFKCFQGKDCGSVSTVKEIYESEVIVKEDRISYRVKGSGFLKQMVRIITGTIIDIGKSRLDLSMEEIIEAKDRKVAGRTAPPEGLYLNRVFY